MRTGKSVRFMFYISCFAADVQGFISLSLKSLCIMIKKQSNFRETFPIFSK